MDKTSPHKPSFFVQRAPDIYATALRVLADHGSDAQGAQGFWDLCRDCLQIESLHVFNLDDATDGISPYLSSPSAGNSAHGPLDIRRAPNQQTMVPDTAADGFERSLAEWLETRYGLWRMDRESQRALAVGVNDANHPLVPFDRSDCEQSGVILNALALFESVRNEPTRKEMDRYRRLIEGSPYIAYLADRQGKLLFISEQVRSLGFDPAAMIGQNLTDFVLPEDVPQVRLDFERAVRSGKEITTEFRVPTPNGWIEYFQDYARIVCDSKGQPENIIGFISTVPEQRRMDERLKETRTHLRRFIEMCPEFVVLSDVDGVIVDINQPALRILNRTREETLGRTTLELGIWPTADARDDYIRTLVMDGKVSNLQRPVQLDDGRQGVVLISAQMIEINDEPHVLAFATEMTQLHEAQEKLRAGETEARRNSQDLKTLVHVTNELSQIHAIDELTRRAVLLGRDRLGFERIQIGLYDRSTDQLRGAWGVDRYGDISDQRKRLYIRLAGVMKTHFRSLRARHLRLEDYELFDGDLPVGRGETVIAPLRDGETTVGMIAIDNLITHRPINENRISLFLLYASAIGGLCGRIRMETERRHMDALAQESQKLESLGILAGGIAHDFNNLLMSAMGNMDLALMDLDPESAPAACLNEIGKTVARMADLTDQMLAYSGRGLFVTRPFDLNELILESRERFALAVGAEIKLLYDLTSHPTKVKGDAGQIRQTILNLLTNAREAIAERKERRQNGHTMAGEGQVSLRTRVVHCDTAHFRKTFPRQEGEVGHYVLVEVSDNGVGMSQDVLAKAFEPFFSTKFVGRGLGLSSVLGIIRSHKGAITIETVPNERTAFGLYFKAIDQPPPSPKKAPNAEASIPSDDPASNAGRHILLIDDDPSVRDVGSRYLAHLGFQVTQTNKSVAAWTALRDRTNFHCIIVDQPPNGREDNPFLSEIRARAPETPIIMTTSASDVTPTAPYGPARINSILIKPYNLASLRAALAEARQVVDHDV